MPITVVRNTLTLPALQSQRPRRDLWSGRKELLRVVLFRCLQVGVLYQSNVPFQHGKERGDILEQQHSNEREVVPGSHGGP